jgi:hypothetical protein
MVQEGQMNTMKMKMKYKYLLLNTPMIYLKKTMPRLF